MDGLNQLAGEFSSDLSWASIPIDVLLAELERRHNAAASDDGSTTTRPQCGSGKKGSYDTPLHVFALILILALSTLACGFPLISTRGRGRRQNNIVFICQHFGTGVLIATAFVHLLPTAFSSLTDPCLPYFFSQGYTPLPGFIAMISALVVVGLESYLTTRGAGHSHSHSHGRWDDGDQEEEQEDRPIEISRARSSSIAARRGSLRRPADIALDDLGASEGLIAGVSPLPESTPTLPMNGKRASGDEYNRRTKAFHDDDDPADDRVSLDLDLELDLEELEPSRLDGADSRPLTHTTRTTADAAPKTPTTPSGPRPPPTPEEQKRQLLQCLLLEAGILFHSIFIGMAISVATGPPFVVFLVAIAFHQTFEGLALGSRIAALHFPRSSPRPWLMVLAYGTTTPLGQAVGLAVHGFYDPLSRTGLLMVGFMNAVSSGLLLFAGLVQLLAEDFLSEKSYGTLRGRRRVQAFLAVLGGAALMAVVGAFA